MLSVSDTESDTDHAKIEPNISRDYISDTESLTLEVVEKKYQKYNTETIKDVQPANL